MVHERFKGEKYYKTILSDGKVDPVKSQPKGTTRETEQSVPVHSILENAIQQYENSRFPSTIDVHKMFDTIGTKKKGKETISQEQKVYIATKMSEWFAQGRMGHIKEIILFQNGALYDQT